MSSSTNQKPWKASVLTLFPEAFPGTLGVSVVGQGLENNLWELETVNIRDYAEGKHKTVDDIPYGGGAGMVMKADVLDKAVSSVAAQGRPIIYLSPRGKPFDQKMAKKYAKNSGIILLCGRYEGIDERLLDLHPIELVSLGDYILAGGEVAAQTMIESCVRLLPGVLGDADSLAQESFEDGLLEYPHYTRPAEYKDLDVPDVLRSGNHKKIDQWRKAQAEEITKKHRPDMWAAYGAKDN